MDSPNLPPPPPPRVPPPPTQNAGWHEDPWKQGTWRWHDGQQWTAHIDAPVTGAVAPPQPNAPHPQRATSPARKPRLPSFLSVPVAIAAIPTVGLLGYSLVTSPFATLLGLTTLFIVAPPLIWMDRLEPEPRSSTLHTFLWGACVAGSISLVVNTIVATAAGEVVAAVASAPIIEEITKTGAIVWMVRRRVSPCLQAWSRI